TDDNLPPRLSAVVGGIGSGQYFELAHGVEDRAVQGLISSLVVIVDAILYVVVCDFAVTSNVESSAESQRRVLSWSEDIRLQLCELQIVAPVERELLDLLLIHDVTEAGILRLHHQSAARYSDCLLYFPHGKHQVESSFLSGLQHYAIAKLPL